MYEGILAEAARKAADPLSQRETVEKRATWTFASIGIVGTALSGFSVIGADQTGRSAWFVVAVVALSLVAIVLAGMSQVLLGRAVVLSDIQDIKHYFTTTIRTGRLLVNAAMISLLMAVALAATGAITEFFREDSASLSLSWADGADGPEIAGSVEVPLDVAEEVRVELRAAREPMDAAADQMVDDSAGSLLYAASLRAGREEVQELEFSHPVGGAGRYTLTILDSAGGELDELSLVVAAADSLADVATDPVGLDATVTGTQASLNDYWMTTLSAVVSGDSEFTPPETIQYDSSTRRPPPPCGGVEQALDEVSNDIFYCRPDNTVNWDRALLRDVAERFGRHAVAVVLAHEWAHSLQSILPRSSSSNGWRAELQADCFAGAWASTADSALVGEDHGWPAGYADIVLEYDEFDAQSKDDYVSARERVVAFSDGFAAGVEACLAY